MRLCVLQETILREQVEGLVEENEEEAGPNEGEEVVVGAIATAEKKTERQRKRERAEKIKVQTQILFDFYFRSNWTVLLLLSKSNSVIAYIVSLYS